MFEDLTRWCSVSDICVLIYKTFVYLSLSPVRPLGPTPRTPRPPGSLGKSGKTHRFVLCYWEMAETYVSADVSWLICIACLPQPQPPVAGADCLPLKNDKQTETRQKREGRTVFRERGNGALHIFGEILMVESGYRFVGLSVTSTNCPHNLCSSHAAVCSVSLQNA